MWTLFWAAIFLVMKEKIIWAAGFFDGEGWVGSRNSNRYINKKGVLRIYRCIQIAVSQVNPDPIKIFHEMFGSGYRTKWLNGNNRTQFEWRATANDAIRVLKILLPYLVVKREEAEIAIKFHELVWRKSKITRTTEQLLEEESLLKELSRLKKRIYLTK